MSRFITACAGISILVAACQAPRERRSSSDHNRLTAAEIARTDAQNAYQAVANLRPNWLLGRGTTSIRDPQTSVLDVYLDGVSTGSGPEYLTGIHVSQVLEMRFYDAAQAGVRFGMGHPRGVLDVITVRDYTIDSLTR